MSGNAGCNDYTGSYTVDGEVLTIGPLAATKKACGPAESAVETAFLTVMEKVATYSVSGDTLELKTADAKVRLKFAATQAAGLTKTRWVATGVNNGKGAVSSVVIDTTLTAIFDWGRHRRRVRRLQRLQRAVHQRRLDDQDRPARRHQEAVQ